MPVEALLVSTGVVARAQIGDKTPLLARLLATRFRGPVPIVLGIFVATLANHAFASAAGNWLDGAFLTTVIALCLVEMGNKTQIATDALAALGAYSRSFTNAIRT